MPAESPFTSVLVLSLCLAACTNQDPYDLHFPDGREVIGVKGGIQSCLNAFRANVRLTPGGDEGVCVSHKKDGKALRVRPRELTDLWEGKPPVTKQDLRGELAIMEVGRDVLPPWARGSFYSLGWSIK